MAKRTRLGLGLFFNNTTNSGIVNYIYNIVAALNSLPENEQPEIILFYNTSAPIEYIEGIGYRKLQSILFQSAPTNRFLKFLNICFIKVTKKNIYVELKYFRLIDSFYPYFPAEKTVFQNFENKIEWLVDFNNKFFPNHYSDGGTLINSHQECTTSKVSKIVLSSFSLKDELEHFYPNFRNHVKVMRFACSLPTLDNILISEINNKYSIRMKYFMSPNQFWEHKNQIVVLEAIKLLIEKKPEFKFKVLFTGSLDVNRGRGKYIDTLKSYIKQHQLEAYVEFLGVIDREEQLILMKNSIALIQPSLYEGWSTLVEEAKALNKFILLSNLKVHREQIEENAAFFEPHDAYSLANHMEKELVNPTDVKEVNYVNNIKEFGREIVNSLCN